MRTSAIVVAGGSGTRMKSGIRKQYLSLSGRPVLSHTLQAFDACPAVDRMILVVPEGDMAFCRDSVLAPSGLQKPVRLVSGGKERQESVYNGLLAARGEADIVAIHDGVRPFVSSDQIAETVRLASETGACMLGIPASDTLKQVDGDGNVRQTLDRKTVWLAQTPQTFRYDLILTAHESARRGGYSGTDDASLAERMGVAVRVIPGSRLNIKLTTPEDLVLAEAVIGARLAF
ncbi:2-C-methyl-D-erythritol 4-phosphate cytidylyltra nsferase [Desulfonema ishimotonii]|uniref:2-C-methyl-D-erythritol 4-phosphate cytidylyltransferase n=1 Tax=Desulfonema ishimotonii TaxID=45657 RepID=A0A401FSY7_9BACT|nr:2-C-methyl-D-erythritol 4-phosphate cytidylyltransferase [Desulfonema ishimotonii]GBC60081.1 2-C-methyl-D-erythritol 4-phosphate cytidylyltra nsferase [Desulfonema ishimotonii]